MKEIEKYIGEDVYVSHPYGIFRGKMEKDGFSYVVWNDKMYVQFSERDIHTVLKNKYIAIVLN